MEQFKQIAFLGDYFPRQCGIATFTNDLRTAIAGEYPQTECLVVSVNDKEDGYDYPEEVRFEILEQDMRGYKRAANFLNFNNTDVVSLQHEFGIYGGSAGSHVLGLLQKLRMPVVTTLHTILEEPNLEQMQVMKQLIALSARLVTMSERGKNFLQDIYHVPEERIDLIPHGVPDMPFVDPNFYKDQFNAEGKYVLLTFGLLSPNKGIETVLKMLPAVVAEFPDLVYIVLGATHPAIIRQHGESYRRSLEQMTIDLNIQKNVVFYNRFVDLEELKEFIGAADLYITPYLNRDQITSGTLSYAFGCGKAVVSTPYWHAEELLAEDRGVLVPFGDETVMAREIIDLLRDKARRHAMRKRAYMLGRDMIWSNVAQLYVDSFEKARRGFSAKFALSQASKIRMKQKKELPEIRLDHLIRMTDTTGIFQHARFSIPRLEDGYCTDDNARALLLAIKLEESGIEQEQIAKLATRYAAFIAYAFNPERKRFRNFMLFNRHWTEEEGSDDSQGRALWALGACVGRTNSLSLRAWASQLFEQALPTIPDLSSPRSWAFGITGIYEYLRRFSGDRIAGNILETLSNKLIQCYENSVEKDWQWYENILAYDNARLSHALLLASRVMPNGRGHKAQEIGLRTLRWLLKVQTAEGGHFRPIGSEGWYPREGNRALFDQQPLEAYATISACLEAYRITEDSFWLDNARIAFEWFLGRNDIGIPLFDPKTGGCYDGLHVDRLNQNQGAESTLSFLLSLTEMHGIEQLERNVNLADVSNKILSELV